MKNVDQDIDRALTLLRNKIRERGFTQLEVQGELGWGRSYISQLLTRQKALRLEQVLLILHVIDVSPQEYFGELYGPLTPRAGADRHGLPGESAEVRSELEHFRATFDGVVDVLLQKGLMSRDDLRQAMAGTEVAAEEDAGGSAG